MPLKEKKAKPSTKTQKTSLKNKNVIEQYLGTFLILLQMNNNPRPKGWKYYGEYDFLLEHGQEFKIEPLPPELKRGKTKECYTNAAELVIRNPNRFVYVEGYAMMTIMPIHHAWVYDKQTKKAYEITTDYNKNFVYFGIPFKTQYLAKGLLKNGGASLLEFLDGSGDGLFSGKDTDFKEKI